MNASKKISIAVMGLPIRERNGQLEFLLSQRHQPSNALWHNKWQQIGGGVEWGETPEQALAREFEEEAQLSCRILHPFPSLRTSLWTKAESKTKYDTHILLLSYIVDIGKQIPDCSQDEETHKIDWFSLSEAVKLDALPNLKEFILEANQIISEQKLLKKLK